MILRFPKIDIWRSNHRLARRSYRLGHPGQVRQGIHRNPQLPLFPPGAGKKIPTLVENDNPMEILEYRVT